MDVYDLITKRRSTRNFEDPPIPEPIIEHLVDAALNAPSDAMVAMNGVWPLRMKMASVQEHRSL